MRFFSLKLNTLKGKLFGSRAKNTEIRTNAINCRMGATPRRALGRYLLPQIVQEHDPHQGVKTHDNDSWQKSQAADFMEGVLLTWVKKLPMSLVECQF